MTVTFDCEYAGMMARIVLFASFLSLLTVAFATNELFFAEELIDHYGKNFGLEVGGLGDLIADVGGEKYDVEHTGHGMMCGEDSWIGNETCLKQMVSHRYTNFILAYAGVLLFRNSYQIPSHVKCYTWNGILKALH